MVIAALTALVAVASVFKFLLSTKVEEKNMGWFHRRVLRAVPVQALKIVVVVWQILTQVCLCCACMCAECTGFPLEGP